ncbi:MAG: exodeoxyribonuclease VII large subunit [Spirulinaceae cyanobacterium SM2_1_0]|nr:exodeoxyribonuclease VII large subunit [Spirulinaceae cyanobacterium SM2_1_0]
MLETALSVGGLTDYIKSLLEDDPQLYQVWVTGEVTSVSDHRSGLFFTLSDPDGEATMRSVVWGNLRQKLTCWPAHGEQVIVLGRVRLYAKRGEYQLAAVQILPAGEGLRALRDRQLRDRLTAEGLFRAERKRPLPAQPRVIAVVTSPTAAAWGDIQKTLCQRAPGLHVLLSPAVVQGDLAPLSIVQALARVEQDDRAELTILARGGGAVEDLACFNDERVVRAIADARRPVIAGIGHERDAVLADLVADASTHTPTAAAELAVPDYAQLDREHRQRRNALLVALQRSLDRRAQHLATLKQQLCVLPERARGWQQAQARCQALRERLTALDPQAVLARGYAIARQANGRVVRDGMAIAPGSELTLQLAQGRLRVQVLATLTEADSPDA